MRLEKRVASLPGAMAVVAALLTFCAAAGAQQPADRFQLPAPPGDGRRTKVELSGTWQLFRYEDPDMDKDRFQAVEELPDLGQMEPMSVQVPGSVRGKEGMEGCHRFIYRTRAAVPAAHRGRGFYLHFAGTNWIVSVFVNGELAATHTGVWIPWDADISGHVQPGEVNELAIAVKSPWYGWDTRVKDPLGRPGTGDLEAFKDRSSLGRPSLVPYGGKGDGNGSDYGIVNPVYLHSVGGTYLQDIFVKPSVADKRLETELTLRNTTDRERTLRVEREAVYDATGRVEKVLSPVEVTLPAGRSRMVSISGRWADPRLWWPEPDPHLYRLRTTLLEDDQPVDIHEQLFGFREVTVDGTEIRLNGVRYNLWGWWGLRSRIESEAEYAEQLRAERTRFNRFFSHTPLRQFRRAQEDRLEYYDRHGITGAQASMIEGMGVHFVLSYLKEDTETGEQKLVLNEPVWRNFRRHMAQIARAYRNHPSVLMYSLENETVYINAANFYGWVAHTGISYEDYMTLHEEAMNRVADAAREHDSTRPYIVSGAGDLSCRLPIIAWHYPRGATDWYPENAYTLEKLADKVSRWPWKHRKPVWIPESTFGSEVPLGTYAVGDAAYASQRAAQRGKAVFQRMLFGGYRWAGIGWSCCGNYSQFPEVQAMLGDLCVVPRKQTHRLYAGRKNAIRVKVMNDTFSNEPTTFTWSYTAEGRQVAGGSATLDIEPGFGEEQTLQIEAPETDRRLEGTLTLKASHPKATAYVDERSVPVLPLVDSLRVEAPLTLFDRSGKVAPFLKEAGLEYRSIDSLDGLDGGDGLLIVGPDTLTEAEAYGQRLLRSVHEGLRAVVLEQQTPLGGSALPVAVPTTEHYGGYAHPQGLGTHVFRDIGKKDLIDWAGDFPTYKNVYRKPSSGGRSLVHCGPNLPYSALMEMPVGRGFLVLCQLRVGAKLGVDPAADILMRNLVEHYAASRPSKAVAALYAPDDPLLKSNLQKAGMLTEPVGGLPAALDADSYRVAVVHASAGNLSALQTLRERVGAFQQAGGWIMLAGVGPDGIEEFNRLVDTNRMLRPFRLERVTLEARGHPLAATLGNSDVGLVSDQHIQHGRMWPSAHTFSHVMDGRDFAPFCRPPGAPDDPFAYEPTRNDKDPYNFVNGLFNELSWRCIRQIWWEGTEPKDLTFHLRRPDTLSRVRIWNNANYSTIKDVRIFFDGDPETGTELQLPDGAGMGEVELPEPRRVEKSITIRLLSKREHRNPNLVGIDNLQFLRPDAPGDAVYMDSVGGLVAFPRGNGGFFVSQVKFMEEEPRAENTDKKRNLAGVLLQNMGVGVSSKVALPGVNIRYRPVDIGNYCNQYRDSRWVKENVWFGKPGIDLDALEVGEGGDVVLAGVRYRLVHFTTAPKQDCIMLGAPGAPREFPEAVTGIPVNDEADLLFSLHAANVTEPITEQERERMVARKNPFRLPEVMHYVLHYADGQMATVPVMLEKHVDHYLQRQPAALEGAQVAWTQRVEDAAGRQLVLYSMRARNPRPQARIETVDVALPEENRRAVPTVLAFTLGDIAE